MIHKNDELVKCPYCGEEQEDIAEDYVIPGRIGITSRALDTCHECGKEFAVMRISEDELDITYGD